MADADHFIADLRTRADSARDEVVHRLLLCFIVAGIEAVVAFTVVFGSALLYHLIFLHQTASEFAAVFYGAYGVWTGLLYATFAAIAWSQFLERRVSGPLDLQQAFFSWTAAIALTLLTAFLLGMVGDISRVSLTSAYVVGIPAMFGMRSFLRGFLEERITNGALQFETIAVIGNRADVLNFVLAGELWRQGHRVVTTLHFEDVRGPNGKIDREALSAFVARNVRRGTDHVVFVGSLTELDELDGMVATLKRYAVNVLYAPAARSLTLKFLDVVAIGPNNVLRIVRTPMSKSSVLLKRAFDITLAGLGLLVLLPFLALVALAIVAETRGPVIYKQARRGFNGETFMIWKFRSMSVTESGYKITQAQKDDPRITRVGRFIRATSIDELPQLINVLIGQMSLVGPRPHAISHDEELSHQLAVYAHRQRIKPGITGWAQVHGFRGETSNQAQIEGRVAHDIYYIDNWSIFLDIWTLVLTVFSPATRRNAH
jgi:Undecaprenyl-phosphate glucose phosphotransferase